MQSMVAQAQFAASMVNVCSRTVPVPAGSIHLTLSRDLTRSASKIEKEKTATCDLMANAVVAEAAEAAGY
jgi:hypothetical protein